MTASKSARKRVIAATAAITMAVGAASCGSDGGGDAKASARENDEQAIKQTYAKLVRAFYAPDPKAGCSVMTEQFQKQFGQSTAIGGGKHKTCEAKFRAVISPTEFAADKPFIVRIRFRGSNAVAQVKTKKSRQYEVPFTRVNGQWKVSGGV
jgi:hypothetical protein